MLKGNYLITIDPGSRGTGYAVWDLDFFNEYKKPKLVENGVWPPSRRNPILRKFKKLLLKFNSTKVVIENASFMDGNARTQAAARSGALVKLAQFIGRIQQICEDVGVKWELIEVNKWKGSLPKEIVKRRILRVMPRIRAKSHDWDAIGIGLYYQGVMK